MDLRRLIGNHLTPRTPQRVVPVLPGNTMSEREWAEYDQFMIQEALRASKQTGNNDGEDIVDGSDSLDDFDDGMEGVIYTGQLPNFSPPPYVPIPPPVAPRIQLPLFVPTIPVINPPITSAIVPTTPTVPKRAKPPLPLLTPEQRQDFLVQYRKYWTQIYGVDPNLAERARLFRERELAKMGGPDAIREKRLQEFALKIESKEKSPSERATLLIQRLYRHYRNIVCENQSAHGRHLGEIVLRIEMSGAVKYLCYDVMGLMTHLQYAYHREDLWKDPTYGVPLTAGQRHILHYRHDKLNQISSQARSMSVGNTGTDRISIPRSLFNRAMSEESSPYLLYRITNPFTRLSTYIVAMDFHDLDSNTIFLSPAILSQLKLAEDDILLMEEAFHLPKASYLLLKPLTPEWYALPESDTDIVKGILTATLEKEYTVSMGTTLTISHRGKTYPLQVIDISATMVYGSRRTYSAMTKFTSVKIEIIPESRGHSSVKTDLSSKA